MGSNDIWSLCRQGRIFGALALAFGVCDMRYVWKM
jgi:hypothetical protein